MFGRIMYILSRDRLNELNRMNWRLEKHAKTIMLNNNVIALASTKEYSSENLEYFRLKSK